MANKVLKHPLGLYVLEWSERQPDGIWKFTRAELVPKARASSYAKRSEMKDAIAFFAPVELIVEPR